MLLINWKEQAEHACSIMIIIIMIIIIIMNSNNDDNNNSISNNEEGPPSKNLYEAIIKNKSTEIEEFVLL